MKHIKDMSLQEMFDAAASGLLKQRARSLEPGVGCAYRGANGMKCAVGFMLADEYYLPTFESEDATSVLGRLGVTEANKIIIAEELQTIHDSEPIARWPSRLAEMADRYSLSTAVMEGME